MHILILFETNHGRPGDYCAHIFLVNDIFFETNYGRPGGLLRAYISS